MTEFMCVDRALIVVDKASPPTVLSTTDIVLLFHAARVLAAEVRALRADLDLSPEETEQAIEIACSMSDDVPGGYQEQRAVEDRRLREDSDKVQEITQIRNRNSGNELWF